MKIPILGVYIDNMRKKEAKNIVRGWLENSKDQHKIFTPNPEFLVEAYHNPKFRRTLNDGSLNIPDGFGLKLIAPLYNIKLKEIIPGADFMDDICALAQALNKSVFLLGGRGESAQLAAQRLKIKYPKLKIAGAIYGPKNAYERGEENDKLINTINGLKPDILFVAFGAPKQEFWIEDNLKRMPCVKIAMGVGGSLDYISGIIPRAPSILKKLGLEWLYRLIIEPERAGRIFNAVVLFPILALRWRIGSSIFYRKNIAVFLFKRSGKVLVVERKVGGSHWQIPQGGVESGESLKDALMRETREEIGTNNFKIIKKIKNFFSYDWKIWDENNIPLKYGKRGQKQTIFFLEFTGQDSDIKLDNKELKSFKWVDTDKAAQNVHPVRREMTEKAQRYCQNHILEKYDKG